MNYVLENFIEYCDSMEIVNEAKLPETIKKKFNEIKKDNQKKYFDFVKKGLFNSIKKYNDILSEISKIVKSTKNEKYLDKLDEMTKLSKELTDRAKKLESPKEVMSINSDIEKAINAAIKFAKTIPNYKENRALDKMIRNKEWMNAFASQNVMYQQMYDQQNQMAIQQQQQLINQQLINQQAVDNAIRASQPMAFGGYMPNSAFGMF